MRFYKNVIFSQLQGQRKGTVTDYDMKLLTIRTEINTSPWKHLFQGCTTRDALMEINCSCHFEISNKS